MSIFAIQVETGKEADAKKLINEYIKHFNFKEILKVYSFQETITYYHYKASHIKKKVKSKIPGYIFVQIQENVMEIPGRIWHFLKSVWLLKRILPFSIRPEELSHFFEVESKDESVEIVMSTEEREEVERNILIFANQKRNKKKVKFFWNLLKHFQEIPRNKDKLCLKNFREYVVKPFQMIGLLDFYSKGSTKKRANNTSCINSKK